MPTPSGKVKLQAHISRTARVKFVAVLDRAESLGDAVETALMAEFDKRYAAASEESRAEIDRRIQRSSEEEDRLPPGRRPKP